MRRLFFALFVQIALTSLSFAQDSSGKEVSPISSKYLDAVSSKAKELNNKLDKKSEKALAQLQKQEEKLKQKLGKIDSLAAKNIFGNINDKYKQLEEKLNLPRKLNTYIPHLDSVATSLNFLNQNPQLLNQAKEIKDKLKDAIGKVDALKAQLQKAEDIKKFLKERKQYLKEQLEKFGLAKQLKKINKQVYYYAQQVNEYKDILKDPKKAEKKALELLSKTKLFRDFMRKNSMLASLFRIPDPDNPTSTTSLAGLQTRVQVNSLIQTQIAAGGPNAQAQFQQNLQAAQSQLNELKNKILKAGGGNSDAEMPEGFKPNNQKTKSFFKRLELGTNIQSQKSNGFLPVTSDFGLSVGYKLNDKSIIGVGASYKLGWGRNIQNIRISHQGVGARSFIDWKLKGSLWISGGFEMNYRSEFRNIAVLHNYSAWQQSGLIGISKTMPVKSKFLKKAKLMLAWDPLSYQQIPRTQAIIFRIGYSIK